ncbi:MAG: PEP/pyruvate-binding domain-containing protein [bacterium]
MEQIRMLADLTKSDSKIAGGKGASLGEMMSNGFSVPDGFVVLSTVFEKNILDKNESKINETLSKIDYKDSESILSASEKIQNMIMRYNFSSDLVEDINNNFQSLDAEFVAVRSSATAEDGVDTSWAGELESYLNTTEENLLQNIKRCWASLYTSRAIYYRYENNLLNKHISVAVIVQSMIPSEVSGIAFTVHPVTKNIDQILVEAGFGLGESIVSGSITPDKYLINKSNLSIEDVHISSQEIETARSREGTLIVPISEDKRGLQKLMGREIVKLAEICLKIENHYNFPCDIEWAFSRGKLYIVQSRPITTI